MRRGDERGVREVGEGSSDLEHPVERSQGQTQALVGSVEEGLGGGVDCHVAPESRAVQGGVGGGGGLQAITLPLDFSSSGDPGGDFCGRRPGSLTELGEAEGRHLDVEVDAIEERTGNPAAIPFDEVRRAPTGVTGIPEVTTRTGIHGGHESETRGESKARPRADDGYLAVFEGLAKRFESVPAKFRQFVEKEDSVVSQADLAGTRYGATTDQGGRRNRGMRAAEGPAVNQPPRALLGGQRMNLRHRDRFGAAQGGQIGRAHV
jgi:hypothetical protein